MITATKVIRQEGPAKAVEVLREGVKVAQDKGLKKASPKHMPKTEPPRPQIESPEVVAERERIIALLESEVPCYDRAPFRLNSEWLRTTLEPKP